MKKTKPSIRFAGFTADWEERKLGDIAKRFDNLRVPITASDRKPGDTPYYGANGIQDYVEGFTHDGEFILVAEDGANDLKNYPVQYVNGKVWVNNHAHVLQGKKTETDNKFLMNSIKKFNIEPFLVGGGRAKLNADVMMKLNILLPSFKEQQKIGAFFKQLDNTIALHQRQLDLLKEQKKGFLQKMFPKQGAKVPELRFAEFTDDWVQRKLGDMMDVSSVKRIHQSDWTRSGVPFYRARDIVAKSKGKVIEEPIYISQDKYDEYSAVSGKVQSGDLLVTGVGTIGVPLLIDGREPLYFKDGNIIWFKNNHAINGSFFFHQFQTQRVQKFIRDVAGIGTVGTYTIDTGKKTPFNLPIDKFEQQRVGQFFDTLDNLIAANQRQLELLNEKKKGYLQKMFVQWQLFIEWET